VEEKKKILITDDSEMNRMILDDMLGDEFQIIEAVNGKQAIDIIEKMGTSLDVILLDIVMPEMDGFDVLAKMNQNGWIDEIPVIMISAENTASYMHRAYELGAVDYITRPFDDIVVQKRVVNTIMLYAKQKQLVRIIAEQVYEKERSNNLMVSILSHIVEFRNGESGLHVLHINTMTEILLNILITKTDKYNLSPSDIAIISMASSLHDIGKIAIPSEILNKPGKLTKEEFEVMKTHTTVGAQMLEDVPFGKEEHLVEASYEICRWHHERYDGRGYPDGLKGDEIPISAQIVSIADVYDALTSERVYKPAFSHDQAMQMILNGECGSFSPLLLECLQEAAPAIQKQLSVNSYTTNEQVQIEKMTEDLLKSQDLLTSEQSLQIFEKSSVNYREFEVAMHEAQFEYDVKSDVLLISEWGAKRLGTKEVIAAPRENKELKAVLGEDNIKKICSIVKEVVPEKSLIEDTIFIDNQQYKIICRVLWTEDGKHQAYVGTIIEI
jgi:putative two-component system response regulator